MHAVPGHTAPSFPCCPSRGVCWLPVGDGYSCCWPPGPEPSCCPMHPLWGKPIGFQAQWSREEGHQEGCWIEIKLYAAISKNLVFMKNTHLKGKIHQGVVDGCQKPTVPTLLQNQHQLSKCQRCTRMQESWCFSSLPYSGHRRSCSPGRTAPAQGEQPLSMGSSQLFHQEPTAVNGKPTSPYRSRLHWLRILKIRAAGANLCALWSRGPDVELTHGSWSTLPAGH